jgi:hypothetical protein
VIGHFAVTPAVADAANLAPGATALPYVKMREFNHGLHGRHGLLASNISFVRVGLCLSVVVLNSELLGRITARKQRIKTRPPKQSLTPLRIHARQRF